MADVKHEVKNTGKTAESGGITNVSGSVPAAKPAKEAEVAPKNFSEAQAKYEAEDAAAEAERAASATGPEDESEPKPSKGTLEEQKAGVEAGK